MPQNHCGVSRGGISPSFEQNFLAELEFRLRAPQCALYQGMASAARTARQENMVFLGPAVKIESSIKLAND